MIDREKVIKGLECCMSDTDTAWPKCEECPYNDTHDSCASMRSMLADAIALLKAQSGELDRLKLCRHNCKIECLLDEYNKVVAERDALRKAQEPVEPIRHQVGRWFKTWRCGACGSTLMFRYGEDKPNYCTECGRAVKWDA